MEEIQEGYYRVTFPEAEQVLLIHFDDRGTPLIDIFCEGLPITAPLALVEGRVKLERIPEFPNGPYVPERAPLCGSQQASP